MNGTQLSQQKETGNERDGGTREGGTVGRTCMKEIGISEAELKYFVPKNDVRTYLKMVYDSRCSFKSL